MKLFYALIINNQFELDPEEAHHIQKVLRLKEGERICVTNGKGYWANAELLYFGKKTQLKHDEIQFSEKTNTTHLKIAIAPTKNLDRIEFFVEKATELNIDEIQFILCENSERKNLNLEKLQKKAIAACKQSLRFHFPIIHEIIKLNDFISQCDAANTYVAHCDKKLERIRLHDIKLAEKMCFLVGPEGDFSLKEIENLSQKNIVSLSLGFQRLRTETAGLFLANWAYSNEL